MARFIKTITGRNEPVTHSLLIAASQTVAVGDLIEITSGKGVLAVAASTTLIGIAQEAITTGVSVDDTDRIPVILLEGAIVRIDYTGTSKTTIADADMYGTAFDLSDEKTIDLDDTTGGMCKVVGYDNTASTADVVIARANLALQ